MKNFTHELSSNFVDKAKRSDEGIGDCSIRSVEYPQNFLSSRVIS